jgi:hypothetical protein
LFNHLFAVLAVTKLSVSLCIFVHLHQTLSAINSPGELGGIRS